LIDGFVGCVCAGPLEGIERTEKSCSYNEYFNQVDKDGLGPTDAIIRESITTIGYVIVRPLSTVGYTSVVASVIHSRRWSN